MELLDPLALARWQFGLTTVYHYLFVPFTIGMAFATAIMQTMWLRTGNVRWLHLTRLFGKIFLINFAMGVVTGIVQEFQFGMNWSDFSRFTGDVFGAPLALEGLLAFFFEATFIGLWIFGWNKLSPRLHLLTIWATSIGSIMSAYFIIAANSFMQNPVGYELNPTTGRAELVDFWALLTNPVAIAAFPHTIFAAFMFAAGLIIAVSAYHLKRGDHLETYRKSMKFGLWGMVIAFAGTALTGDQLGLAMTAAQPMKMAAAEAMFNSACGANASFSIFTLGTPDGTSELFSVRVPYLLSFLSTHTFDGCVEGINDLNHDYTALYGGATGLEDYSPVLWITYWSFRWMIGLGGAHVLVAVAGLWVTRKKAKRPVKTWMWNVAIWSVPLSLLANLLGWIFAEMGRQPWLIFGLMTTRDGVSPNVTGLEVLISLIAFTVLYAALAVVEFGLIFKVAKKGIDAEEKPAAEKPLESVVY